MELGEKLKTLRLQQNMTLDDLSKKAEVSKSLLSQVERNISFPTVKTLEKIAKACEITISNLFAEIETEGNTHISINSSNGSPSKRLSIVRKDRRKKLVLPGGKMLYELLSPDLKQKIEFIYVHFPAGSGQEEVFNHEGEECGIILEGKLKGYVGDQVILLEEGDSIYFDSTIPHRWENPGEFDMRAIWAITPPSF
jgi:transcriptional regulator with XRE-family HTH domain